MKKEIKLSKESLMTYKREKGKMEIAGPYKFIRKHIWFDQVKPLIGIILLIVIIGVLPTASWLSVFIKWAKLLLPLLTLLQVVAGGILCLLSG